MMKLRDCQRLFTQPICFCLPGTLWLVSLASAHAQQSDPYRAELLPIRSVVTESLSQKGSDPLEASRFSNPFARLAGEGQTPFGIGSKNHDSIASPVPAPSDSAPQRLTIPTISVSSGGSHLLQEKNSSEALPNSKPPGQEALPKTGADDGIVRLLKPLVVEPQNRELLTQRYPNGQVMIEREVAMDQHGNYMNEGSWKMYDMDQQPMGSGRFENGQMVGLWRRTHLEQDHPWLSSVEFRGFRSPFHSSAEFVDGKLHGVWLIKDDQERKVVELTYRAGRRHGSGTWFHPNGEMRRQLAFQDDLLHGVWQEWNAEKSLLNENWFVDGQRIDKQINTFAPDRPESEVSFLEAKLTLAGEDDWWNARLAAYQPTGERIQTGPVKAWFDNGQRHMAGYYKDGERHGEFAWWHDNGHRKLVAKYDKGQRVGKWIWWHDNGIKAAEGTYAADQPIGQWTAWNKVGEITRQRALGTDRETLARPDYDQSGEAIEELPPQLEQGNLNAPIAPSFEELDLTPPHGGAGGGSDTEPPSTGDVNKAEEPTKPADSSNPPASSEANPPPPRPAPGAAETGGTGAQNLKTGEVEELVLGGS
ncbi:MAG: hypothetical protein Q8M16_01505 [Pirellulaceae bacterium]|nr:hypothetical protein [Pirellulaceae bacterium]